jgi:hypothetical protein
MGRRNRYFKGMEDRQITPRGYPNFNSYIKNKRILVFQTDGWTDKRTNGQTGRQMETLIRGGFCNLSIPPGLEKHLASQGMFFVRSKLSITAYLFLVFNRSTALQFTVTIIS